VARRNNIINLLSLAALLAVTGTIPAGRAAAAEPRDLGNGITVVLHTPEELAAGFMTRDKDGSVVVHPSGGRVALTSSGEGLHPFAPSEVVAALAAMRGLSAPVTVEVFILPGIPRETLGSFSRRGAIYLAPGTGPVDPATVAYITTHEMGHVLTWAFVDGQPGRWDAYLEVRGLDYASLRHDQPHAERAREILAEDIRFLFGGIAAVSSRSIQNSRLVLPHRVAGLAELLQGFFRGRGAGPAVVRTQAFPNPCNPMTTIEMIVPAGGVVDARGATLRIFDVRGGLVRTLRGGNLANDRLTFPWDGTRDGGRAAASGRYLYIIESESLVARGAVTLVR
jgi:hypothetical protein